MTDTAWQQKIDHFYEQEFDDDDPHGSVARMRNLLSERPEGDAEALFQLGVGYTMLWDSRTGH